MSKQTVPASLYERARHAAENLYRYDCLESFALKVVVESAERGEAVSHVFINTARFALDRHSTGTLAH